jgi:hypothetical protein
VIQLDSYELNRIILADMYPQANRRQVARGARWRTAAFTGPNAATYEADPEQYRVALETEMFGEPLPAHEHVVNEHSVVKFNGGDPVFLCGHDDGECRIIVRYAEWDETSGTWVPGRAFR